MLRGCTDWADFYAGWQAAKRAEDRLADDTGKAIAAALFTSGDGKRAMRLQFLLQCETPWGGWSEPAAARVIAETIRKQNV
jgi:hypothetical protein